VQNTGRAAAAAAASTSYRGTLHALRRVAASEARPAAGQALR